MKTVKRLWGNIPRKAKIAMNLTAAILLAYLAYVFLSCPAFTHGQKFRRMEKAELVGPAQILASFGADGFLYEHVILAQERDAVLVFQSSSDPWDPGQLTYREKTGAVTVMTIPNVRHDLYSQRIIDLPVFVFHEYPSAVRAELELEFGEGMAYYTEVNWTYGVTTYDKTWHLESGEELGGVFRFNIHAEPEGETISDAYYDHWQPLTSEGTALEVFSRMMEDGDSYIYAAIPATVRLYDEAGTLIAEEHLTIRSINGQRYAQDNQ